MAEIAGVKYLWEVSPRVILLPGGTLEITIQDLWDTLRAAEAGLLQADDDFLIEGAGKVSLGGGQFTGIVLILRNARIAFNTQSAQKSIGTITTVSSFGPLTKVLTAAGATFISDGVVVGDSLVNRTAGVAVPVVDVLSETQIRVLNLDVAIRSPDVFEVGDAYRIFGTIDASVIGGDLVSVEIAGSPDNVNLAPIFPMPFVNATVYQSTQAALLNAGITETGLADAVWSRSLTDFVGMDSAARDILLNSAIQMGDRSTDPDTGILTIRRTLPGGQELVLQGAIWEDFARSIPYRGGGIEVQEELVETSP